MEQTALGLNTIKVLDEAVTNCCFKVRHEVRSRELQSSIFKSIFEKADSFHASDLELPSQYRTNPHPVNKTQNDFRAVEGRGSMDPSNRDKTDLLKETNVT